MDFWVKIKPPGDCRFFVYVSICQGSILVGLPYF